jgi:hypothetical protein
LEKLFDLNEADNETEKEKEEKDEGDNDDDDDTNISDYTNTEREKTDNEKINLQKRKSINSPNAPEDVSPDQSKKCFNLITRDFVALTSFSLLLKMLRTVPAPILPFEKFMFFFTAWQWEVLFFC